MNTKKLLNNKSGFTLLEIIIVIIIIGVLASLALPKLFATVEKSKATEALAAIGATRSALDRCRLQHGTYGSYTGGTCAAYTSLDMADPSSPLAAGSHFTYVFSNMNTNTYTITATRNTYDGGDNTSTIEVIYSEVSNTLTKSGTGVFSGI